MFANSTTLILGAGASVTYGYPVGEKLREAILDISPRELVRYIQLGDMDDDVRLRRCQRFLNEFELAPNLSIDSFLETRNDQNFSALGKIAIAISLLPCEDPEALYKGGGWYRLLFNKLIANKGGSSQLNVVTFNYDRSLEAYLHSAYKTAFGKDNATASRWLKENINFIHVYGLLGDLPDFSAPTDGEREYGDSGLEHVHTSAGKLKLVSRDHQDPAGLFERATQAIENAEYRIFLGFGFDDQNVARLNLQQIRGGVIFSSAHGIDKGHRLRLSRNIKKAAFHFGGYNEGSFEYLRRTDFFSWTAAADLRATELYAEMQNS